jgi:GNAT superfamily N-acetyltransferase
MVKIAYLADHPEHQGIIGQWYWQEWDSYENLPLSHSLKCAKAGAHKDRLDLTLIALDNSNNCVGTIQVMATEHLNDPNFKGLTPWLGSFYVVPEARSGKVALMLFNQLMKDVKRLGYKAAYAFTPSLQKFLRRKGSEQLGQTHYAGKTVDVFKMIIEDTHHG